MNITRRHLIAGAVALASGCAATVGAAETGPRMVRIRYTWPDGATSETVVPVACLGGQARPYLIEQRLRDEDGGGVLVGREVVE